MTRRKISMLTLATLAGLALPTQAQDYELVWSDEFNGNALDLNSWEVQLGTGTAYGLPAGWGNEELQYYTNFSDNISVSDGTLKITARNQNFGGRNFTSGRIRTLGMQDFLYGRFEGRIKLPSTAGVWPAFWMLPSNTPYGTWAASGEIDIMESVNIADRIYGTIHHGAPWPGNVGTGTSIVTGTDYSQDFHDYVIEWEPNAIRWYLDGVQFYSLTNNNWFSTNSSSDKAPFDVPFHLLLNVAVGGQFPGNPNGSSQWPQTMEVDYVRVYQILQSPFGSAPTAIPGRIEVEDFDNGINGQSYFDTDAGNNGAAYRDTDVDIEVSENEGNYNIGWFREGEWLEYTVDVQSTGTYEVEARVAALSTTGSFRIEQDGEVLTSEDVQTPVTNGWQNWQSVTTTVQLDQGVQTIRLANTSGFGEGFNINSMNFTFVSPTCAADLTGNGSVDFADVSLFLGLFADDDLGVDFDGSGTLDFADVSAFLSAFAAGCP